MITVNSTSGGKTSAYISKHFPADYDIFSLVCIDDPECRPKDPAIIQYVNDKLEKYTEYGEFIATAEDDLTLVALMDLEQHIGRRITWVRGKSFDDIIDEKSIFGGKKTLLPNRRFRYCTLEMKLLPIFEWWLQNLGEVVNMRMGFRFDEYVRMEQFMNSGNANIFKYPVSCSLRGQKQTRFADFNWRYCSFPLVKNATVITDIENYWNKEGYIGGDLFTPRKKMVFPTVSNCVGCFHKKIQTLAVMSEVHPNKMKWFAKQEQKNLGTWLDSGITYNQIATSTGWSEEMLFEQGASCDSGGCHD